MNRRRRIARTVGDIVIIPLGNDEVGVAFGLILEEPLVAFFDLLGQPARLPLVPEILGADVVFRIWVSNQPIVDGTWRVTAHVTPPEALLTKPWFFKQDAISRKVTVGRTGTEELPPEPGQLENLERAAVWSAEHVVDRLKDHFAGRPNKWVESLKWRG